MDYEHYGQRDPFLFLMGLELTKHLCLFKVRIYSFTLQKLNGCLPCVHSSDQDQGGSSDLKDTQGL